MPCSSTRCPGRPARTLPHSAGRACAGRVPCWLRAACASWLTRVACAPARCPGWFTLHCDRAVILGSACPGFVGGSFPCLAHHSFPQGASGASAVVHWVLEWPGAQTDNPPPPLRQHALHSRIVAAGLKAPRPVAGSASGMKRVQRVRWPSYRPKPPHAPLPRRPPGSTAVDSVPSGTQQPTPDTAQHSQPPPTHRTRQAGGGEGRGLA